MSRSRLVQRVCHPLTLLVGAPLLLTLLSALLNLRHPAADAQQPAPPTPFPMPEELRHVNLLQQTAEQAYQKSAGCLTCHKDAHDPHYKDTLHLGCCDCHGGNPHTTDKGQA